MIRPRATVAGHVPMSHQFAAELSLLADVDDEARHDWLDERDGAPDDRPTRAEVERDEGAPRLRWRP